MRKKDFPRRELDYRVLERRNRWPGQAAARGQFALFDKGRALRDAIEFAMDGEGKRQREAPAVRYQRSEISEEALNIER